MIYSIYNLLSIFGHLYVYLQELGLYLCYYRMLCRLCVRVEGSCSSSFPHPGHMPCCSAPNSRPPVTKALHTICGNNTSIVSSSWWWAYKCPIHVEQIISAINHSVASSWFSSLRLYYNARTNIHYIHSRDTLLQEAALYTYCKCSAQMVNSVHLCR